MRLTRPMVVWCTLISFLHGPACFAQPYVWERTAQTLRASSNVDVTAQGTPDDFTDSDNTSSAFIHTEAEQEITRPAYGGGGGGGGDAAPGADNGAAGGFGTSVDGDDGGGGAYGGLGGDAGADGTAEASGTAIAIDEVNTDYQSLLSYTWEHNQWGDITVVGGGGGAGGGGGTAFYTPDPCMPGMGSSEMGGAGGDGGGGQTAEATVVSTQTSGVNVAAKCIVDPQTNPPPTTTPPTDTTITFDIGWVSAANPDWVADWGSGSVWERSIAMTITVGLSQVVLNGAPGMSIDLNAIDDSATPYFKSSSDPLDSDTGSFSLGAHEIGFTSISPNDTASIVTPNDGIQSVLRGGMTSYGGEGGFGGEPGMDLNGSANDGTDGADGGSPTGAAGGTGGQGGDAREQDTDGDTIADITSQGGGDGGDGGDGQSIDEHKDGFFTGVINIEMDY